MSEWGLPDANVADELDVDAEMIVLGIAPDELDFELAIGEQGHLELLSGHWDPIAGLEDRIEAQVLEQLRMREAAWLFVDLANLGWQTLKTVFDVEIEGGSNDQ